MKRLKLMLNFSSRRSLTGKLVQIFSQFRYGVLLQQLDAHLLHFAEQNGQPALQGSSSVLQLLVLQNTDSQSCVHLKPQAVCSLGLIPAALCPGRARPPSARDGPDGRRPPLGQWPRPLLPRCLLPPVQPDWVYSEPPQTS